MAFSNKTKRSAKNLWTSVIVMQNGVILAERNYKNSENVLVTLNAIRDRRSSILLPSYHFYDDKESILELKNGKVLLKTSKVWTGLGTSRGEVVECASDIFRETDIEMERDDYFTLSYRDLRVLIKVTPPKIKLNKDYDQSAKGYGGNFLQILVSSDYERNALLAAAFVSIMIISSFAGGLYLNGYHRPRSMADVTDEYVLPFIAPRLIRMAPELLKENFRIQSVVNDMIDYSNAFVEILIGKNSSISERYMDRESISNYQKMHNVSRSDYERMKEVQYSTDKFQSNKPHTKIVVVPTVAGESFDSTLNRALDKMNTMIQSSERILQLRREIVPNFQADAKHTFEDYQNVAAATHKADALKDIKPWVKTTTEEQMYSYVDGLAKQAEARSFAKRASKFGTKNEAPIGIVPGSKFVTFNVDLHDLDDRHLEFVNAVGFLEKEKKEVKRERLSGFIETDKVENFISLNKYQLQICYEIALRRDESSGGIMEWSWKVDSKGRIFDIELIANNISDDKMVKCIREKISQWRFPHPQNGAIQISFPFEFVPTKG